MKKYVTLKCNTCTRTKDSLIDLTHYAPDRCTITLGCEGRLSPVGYTSDGTILLGVPPTGLSNWYPRGSTTTTTKAIKADALYDTSTGSKQQVIIAVSDAVLGFTPSGTATVVLNLLAEQQIAKDYRQYTYRKTGSFTVVNGVEDGIGKKVLRYNIVGLNPDQVEVYVDGVKRTLGLAANDYQLYDGTIGSPVPPNSVLFNTAVTGVAPQVDVIVTKAATVTTAQLTFSRMIDDEARVTLGAWEGIDYVSSPGLTGNWSLFYCDFAEVAPMTVDLKLTLNPTVPSLVIDGPSYVLQPGAGAMLLSRTQVFTQIDRQRAKWINLSVLSTNTDYLIVKLVNTVRRMYVTEASAADLFPVLQAHRFHTPTLQKLTMTGNDDSAQLDNDVIVGPDV